MPQSTRRLAMTQWDVFSSNPLQGNSLAVFFDGRGLTGDEMQSIAKEMNLSETTFILPRDAATERERGVRVRIFTVQEELPFAGHPTLGTAFALRGQRMEKAHERSCARAECRQGAGELRGEYRRAGVRRDAAGRSRVWNETRSRCGCRSNRIAGRKISTIRCRFKPFRQEFHSP